MALQNSLEPQSGILTSSMDVKSREFKEFQLLLSKKADSLSKKQKLHLELLSLQIKIEDYLSANIEDDELLTVGDFLKLYLEKLDIKQNKLAAYIGQRPSNFSKILSGSRKLNFELSFMLGHIFNIDPKAWMSIQIKNEYIALKKDKRKNFQRFTLDDLI